jgi:hypothetical protein
VKRAFANLRVLFKNSGVMLSSVSLSILMLVLGWIGFGQPAIAQPASHQAVLMAWGVDNSQATADEGVGSKIRQGLDNVFGSGTSDQVEDSARESLGNVKGRLNSGEYQKDGLPEGAEGRALDNAYRVQDSAKRLVNDLGETADKTGESARDLFGK